MKVGREKWMDSRELQETKQAALLMDWTLVGRGWGEPVSLLNQSSLGWCLGHRVGHYTVPALGRIQLGEAQE